VTITVRPGSSSNVQQQHLPLTICEGQWWYSRATITPSVFCTAHL